MKKSTGILIILLCSLIQGSGKPRSAGWEEVRNIHIKNNPVCALCGISKDLQVHHIRPFHKYPELELDADNLITLCTSKYWGFSCHLIAGHGGCFKYENPWIYEDIEKLKIIANPAYIKKHGSTDAEKYIRFMKKRVKKFNLKSR